jgi:hypothetical protein
VAGVAGYDRLLCGLRDAPGRIINRNPTNNTAYSRSLANEGGPQIIPAGSEVGTTWTPYGMFVTHPYSVPMPQSLMATAQATAFYNSAYGSVGVGAGPGGGGGGGGSGQADWPNGQQSGPLMRLEPTTSAHHGYMNPTGPNPNMVFFAPPVFGYQTKPIYAVGL